MSEIEMTEEWYQRKKDELVSIMRERGSVVLTKTEREWSPLAAAHIARMKLEGFIVTDIDDMHTKIEEGKNE